jgi:hypothetical protein
MTLICKVLRGFYMNLQLLLHLVFCVFTDAEFFDVTDISIFENHKSHLSSRIDGFFHFGWQFST